MLFVILVVDGANVIQTYYNVNESACICYNNTFFLILKNNYVIDCYLLWKYIQFSHK